MNQTRETRKFLRIYDAPTRLGPVQLPPQVAVALLELLVLLLLHLELALALDAEGVHGVGGALRLLEEHLSPGHALEEATGRTILDDARAVGENADLAVSVGRLFNGEEGLVDAVLRRVVEELLGSSLDLSLAGRGSILRLRNGRRAEGNELAGHGVELDVNAGLGAIVVLDVDLSHGVAMDIGLRLVGNGHLGHGAVEFVSCPREG